ncbi:MAG: chemotaxis response regulator protein-glutamate methylesterase [Immundisolibacteraceae bacterium]|nr:chemotaxis response regulator protein-glutamate methylesterase [Immundisolibacteraceae bacterium]
MNNKSIIRVVVVDDSSTIRNLLTRKLSAFNDIEVVGNAEDALMAQRQIARHKPDVITLDIEMPGKDGLALLKSLMQQHPLPVVMVSGQTEPGADATLKALELGAVDYMTKPSGSSSFNESYYRKLADKIRVAATAKLQILPGPRPPRGTAKPAVKRASQTSRLKLIAIGASTGGTEAIRYLLGQLPTQLPPIVITQHMPAGFTKSFAQRLNLTSKLTVVEAEDGLLLKPGHAYIAPGDAHLKVRHRSDHNLVCQLDQGAKVHHHIPSVDVLFDSVIASVGKHSMGVILTGMGTDGAQGLLRMRNKGCYTIGQDKNSCVIYGMPRAAQLAGAVVDQLPLQQIAEHLLSPPTARPA